MCLEGLPRSRDRSSAKLPILQLGPRGAVVQQPRFTLGLESG